MDLNHPSAGWKMLGGRAYRRREIYDMEWQEVVFPEKEVLIGAPFGGPVAVKRDESKLVKLDTTSMKPQVEIYSSSGRPIGRFPWEKGKIILMAWSDREELVIVLADGTVQLYSLHGENLFQFSLGADFQRDGVADARCYGTGLVVMSTMLQFAVVKNLYEPRPVVLHAPKFKAPPTAWTIIEPRYTLSRNVEVLVATDATIWVLCENNQAQDQLLSNGPFTRLAVSPTGKVLACFTVSGDLWVVSTDFQKNLCSFSTESSAPLQLAWCGPEAVVMYWPGLLLMVGPRGDFEKFEAPHPVQLVEECDGLRLLSRTKCEIIQRVPRAIESIFALGSATPGAELYYAMEDFENKDPKADEKIRGIKSDLNVAVDMCVEAASHEFDCKIQRSLLKAASFGKCFLEFYPSQSFVKMCKTLRVLNAVRHYKVGIPLTIGQYSMLKPHVLIDRLINRHRHLIALRICEYLKIKTNRVLVHWACAKIKLSGASDADITEMILKHLSPIPGISYAEIASTAYNFGRPELATRLLDYEPRAADQVPLLISMKQEEAALVKAISSGDTDLVFLVLLHIKRTTPENFHAVLSSHPMAIKLYESYCKQQNPSMLEELYEKFGMNRARGFVAVREALETKSTDQQIRLLQASINQFRAAKDNFSVKATEDQVKLLMYQQSLEAEFQTNFARLSVTETLYKLVQMNQVSKATDVKKKFSVPDARFHWTVIRGLSDAGAWDVLHQFAAKKSPIGYAPFAKACLRLNAHGEAMKYIPRISDPEEQVAMLLKVGKFSEAATIVAKELKDPERLNEIRNMAAKANDSYGVRQCEKLLAPFTQR